MPSWTFDPPADPDPVHVAADDGVHPDAALLADLDVADHLRAVVDEGWDGRGVRRRGTDEALELYRQGSEATTFEVFL